MRINLGDNEARILDSGWTLIPDPMERCRNQTWWKRIREPNHFFPTYDDDAFWPTRVPGAFNRIHPELEYYEGTVVYLLHFQARTPEADEVALLQFEGVADRCTVFLNGICLGPNEGGYASFCLDVNHALREENRLMVLVNNRRHETSLPGVIHDWFHDGGIHRPVRLVFRPRTYIRDVRVETELHGDEVLVRCGVLISASNRDERLETQIEFQSEGKVDFSLSSSGRAGQWLTSEIRRPRDQVRLWSCDDPFLYEVSVACGEDRWSDRIGLREVRTVGKNILLNGKPVFLRGVCTWNEDPDRGLFSMGKESAAACVEEVKALGGNFVRAGHCPNSRELTRACDEAGLLVWMEIPAYWIPTMNDAALRRTALDMLSGMLTDHRNAPSVILWSIGNECLYHDGEEERTNEVYFLEAAEYIHREDPSRLVTYAGGMEGAASGDADVMKDYTPRLIDALDVLGLNNYAGIHDSAKPETPSAFPENEIKIRKASSFGKPVIWSEVGMDAVKGQLGPDFGEQDQADYHAKVQEAVLHMAQEGILQGVSVFVLNDFRTPIKLTRHHRGIHRKGLITECGVRKDAWVSVQKGFERLKESDL